MDTQKFLVQFDNDDFEFIDAINFKEMLIKIMETHGGYDKLFRKSLTGIDDDDISSMITLYQCLTNSYDKIESVYLISKQIY